MHTGITDAVLIGHAVAVVVHEVAQLGDGLHPAHAGQGAGLAAQRAGRARALVAAADLTEAHEALIGLTITVVVQAIAALWRGARRALTRTPLAVDAGLRARLAGALVLPAGALLARRAHVADAALVGQAVAVLVLGVAGLRARLHAAVAHQRAAHAGQRPGLAGALLAPAGPAEPTELLVREPVAVVVQAVAGLRRRAHVALTGRPQAARAGLCPCLAAPLVVAAGARLAVLTDVAHAALVDQPVAVVVQLVALLRGRGDATLTEHLAVQTRQRAGLAGALALAAGLAHAGEGLVHLAVAVVVHAVAELVHRRHPARALELARHTDGKTRLTAAFVVAAGLVLLGEGLVDLAVAVVVHAVAELVGRPLSALAMGLPVHAGQQTGRARAQVVAAGLADPVHALVGLAVAVVVHAVADLGRGPDRALAGPPEAAHAGLDAGLTGALRQATGPRRVRLTELAGAVLVGLAVAVVVLPVAHLHGRADAASALDRAVHAGQGALGAGPGVLSAGHEHAREALVDLAVAVVVQAVAQLGGRPHEAHAGAPGGINAGLQARDAEPLVRAAGLGAALIAGAADLLLVGLAVAVVVGAIADLGQRPLHALAGDLAGHAGQRAGDAGAGLVTAGLPLAGEGLVGLAVAVVVLTIAQLIRRRRAAVADDLAREADAEAGLAQPLLGTTGRVHLGEGLVDLAVAVVVQAVAAGLVRGLEGRMRQLVALVVAGLPGAALAEGRGLHGAGAHPLLELAPGLIAGGEILGILGVDEAVTVVVHAVADLGRVRMNGGARGAVVAVTPDGQHVAARLVRRAQAAPLVAPPAVAVAVREVHDAALSVLVDLAVTVVVDLVADLLVGHDRADALSPLAMHTGALPLDAGAALGAAGAPLALLALEAHLRVADVLVHAVAARVALVAVSVDHAAHGARAQPQRHQRRQQDHPSLHPGLLEFTSPQSI